MNAQKESLKNNFWGSNKLPQAHKKCAMKMKVELEELEKKRRAPIRRVQKTRLMDIKRLQVNDSSYIEGTICLVNE